MTNNDKKGNSCNLSFFSPSEWTGAPISVIGNLVPAGFPSPADDFMEPSLNLHQLVVKNPAATFFVRVVGDSMRNAGISSGDILVVDRSIAPREGKIVVAVVDGEFTVKRMHYDADGHIVLAPENDAYPSIKIAEGSHFEVWGVVAYVIHKT